MQTERWSSFFSRTFFLVAFALLALAVTEVSANAAGYTILRGIRTPGDLLEYAVVLLVFVIAILLRQIRDGRRAA